MAIELHRFLSDQLERLATSDPDRRLLEGLQETLAGYIEQTGGSDDETPASSIAETLVAAPDTPETPTPLTIDTAAATLYTAPERPAAPEAERLRLDGRLGAAPTYHTTRSGKTLARFPLGVPEEADATRWHTVLVFNERAAKLRAQAPQKGQAATVIGYPHERQLRGKNGEARTITEIYAVTVKLR